MSDIQRRVLIQQLESLQRSGVRQLRRCPGGKTHSHGPLPDPTGPVAVSTPAPDRHCGPSRRVSVAGTPSPPDAPGTPSRPDAAGTLLGSDASGTLPRPDAAATHDGPLELDVLAEQVRQCTRCAELAATRTQTVFGVGNPRARLCFFGEAPGADEDRLGEPFVGRAGQLLNDILKACTLRREDVYILNVLKCRPPGNRTPGREEVVNCREYFQRQLEIIRPEFICCLGAVAASALLETTRSLGSLRGRLHSWRNSQVLVTYHPAYLLRNPSMKREAWIDMQLLMRTMGIELPAATKRGR